MNYLEFVCTGNHGRSPIAQAIAQDHIRRNNLCAQYGTRSSGTLVDAINRDEIPREAQLRTIKLGLDRDLYTIDELHLLERARVRNDEGANRIIHSLYSRAMEKFVREEAMHRRLIEPNLDSPVKRDPEQTIVRDDTIAVVAMDRGNYERVVAIYAGVEQQPQIGTIGDFINEPDLQITHSFGKGFQAYQRAISKLHGLIPLVVDSIVR